MHENCLFFSPKHEFYQIKRFDLGKFYIIHNFFKRGYLYESRKKSTTKKQNVLRAKEHETKKIKNKILSKGEK